MLYCLFSVESLQGGGGDGGGGGGGGVVVGASLKREREEGRSGCAASLFLPLPPAPLPQSLTPPDASLGGSSVS